MSDLPLASEIAPRMERAIGERRAREMARDIEEGRARGGKVQVFGQTIAIGSPDDSRRNQVFCFTHDDLDRLPEILAFYGDRDVQPTFYLSSHGFSAELGKALALAGFHQAAFEQACLYGKPETDPTPTPRGVTVERVSSEETETYLETMAEAFGWPQAWRAGAIAAERRGLDSVGVYPFLARYAGDPAGTGALVVGREVGNLGAGGVIPRFRNRGCHTALLHARLYAAHEVGCSVVVSGASYGSPSFRNQQRLGLQIAYIESTWKKL